ncbi:MAG: hypothetical protein HC781_21830 [Leptolyngbyaceae cyanobacterium CSU_1_4]|nr:hypothetical protein [Leptolyngbyaceae cyanobacterium CSU_1_4]
MKCPNESFIAKTNLFSLSEALSHPRFHPFYLGGNPLKAENLYIRAQTFQMLTLTAVFLCQVFLNLLEIYG